MKSISKIRQALQRVEEATTPTQVSPCAIERTSILMHSMTRGMLVGHRRVAGLISPLTMITDSHRVQGSVPVRLGIHKPGREEPKHIEDNMCSRIITGTCICQNIGATG